MRIFSRYLSLGLLFLGLFLAILSLFLHKNYPLNQRVLATYNSVGDPHYFKYDALNAVEKLNHLWSEIEASDYGEEILPRYQGLGLKEVSALAMQEIAIKGRRFSDFSPEGWVKYLHRRGAVAKIEWVPVQGHPFSGLFNERTKGLLRLSLTYDPHDRGVAPGLALKLLRDGAHSANVAALVSLNGQGDNYNFFEYSKSNIVPKGKSLDQRLVHRIFRRVSRYPEELLLSDFAQVDSKGDTVKEANVFFPRQIFFIPGENLNFGREKKDVREDFLSIPEGTLIYKVYAVPSELSDDLNYSRRYDSEMAALFQSEAIHIANIRTQSNFVASEFGDDGLFFRHEWRNNQRRLLGILPRDLSVNQLLRDAQDLFPF